MDLHNVAMNIYVLTLTMTVWVVLSTTVLGEPLNHSPIAPHYPESSTPQFDQPFSNLNKDGGLWLAVHGMGLDYFDGRTFTHYRHDPADTNSLPSPWVLAIVQDNAGMLWLGTAKGLARFDPALESVRSYDKSNGLQSNQFTWRAQAKASDGRLYFGGVNGLNAFHPDRMFENPHPPAIVLTDFLLFNDPVSVGTTNSLLSKAISMTETLTLKHHQAVFSIKFAALNYQAPEKNRYAYRLDGFDTDWRATQASNRLATYTNLDPGHYEFQVRGANNDGVWNNEGAALSIMVLPPWWQTLWFRILASVATLLTIAAVVHGRMNRVVRYNKLLEAQVANRTKELEIARITAKKASSAKTEFLANMSHKLRTPLNRQNNLPTQAKADLKIILKSGEHLHTLINQVLDLSKIESGRMGTFMETFDLTQMLRELEEMFEPVALNAKDQLTIQCDGDVPRYLRADPVKLRQILINLLNNALKFPHEGRVEMNVRRPPSTGPDGCLLAFEVTDTGPGISDKDQEMLFSTFVQAEAGQKSQEGTGLGLALSRRLVELMDGSLTLQSQLGQGTSVRCELPIRIASINEIAEFSHRIFRQVTALAPGQPHFRILVADDRPAMRYLLIRLLEPLGFSVCEAANGQEAIEQWQKWHPHLILMDLRMPVMDGMSATRHIKATAEGQATLIREYRYSQIWSLLTDQSDSTSTRSP